MKLFIFLPLLPNILTGSLAVMDSLPRCELGAVLDPGTCTCDKSWSDQDPSRHGEVFHNECTDGEQEGLTSDPEVYFRCEKGRWKRMTCPGHTTFNYYSNSCEPSSKPAICKEHQYKVDPAYPHAYFASEHGAWQQGCCFKGYAYDPGKPSCQPQIALLN